MTSPNSYLYNLRGLYLVPVTRSLDRVLHEATYPLALCLWCVQPAFGAYGVGLASKKCFLDSSIY